MLDIKLCCLVLLLGVFCGCSSGNSSNNDDSDEDAFVLAASMFEDGDWNFDYIDLRAADFNGTDFDDYRIQLTNADVTFVGNAVGGVGTVSGITDKSGSWYTTGTHEGWTVGESVTISGAIHGSQLMLRVEADVHAGSFDLITSVYEDDITDVNTSDGFAGPVKYAYCEGGSWATGNATSTCYMDWEGDWVSAASRSPEKLIITAPDQASAFEDGSWAGDLRVNLGFHDSATDTYGGSGGYDWVVFEFTSLSFNGNELSGSGTVKTWTPDSGSPNSSLLSVSDAVSISGEIHGTIVTYTLTGPDGLTWDGFWFVDLTSSANTHDTTPIFSTATSTGGGMSDSDDWISGYSNVSFTLVTPAT